MLIDNFCHLEKSRVIWDKGTSTEKMPLSDSFFLSVKISEGGQPTVCEGGSTPGLMVLGCVRNKAEQALEAS